MNLNSIACNVYGKTVTKWSEEMRLTKDSSGKPKWYDFGIVYDNLTIEAVITSANGASLEALIRSQNRQEEIVVEFEAGEWLYLYTGDFTIKEFESIGRVDKELSEWGYKITLATAEPINMGALPGSRVQCDGAGYITYSNTKIPQPMNFNYQYQTKKYTGLTHGSSFSSELPTNEYDKTSFPVTINSGNMRSLIDDIVAHRGNAFFVTLPTGCYAFGIAQGDGLFTCVQSKRDYTVTNENGDWWSIDIALYNYDPTSGTQIPIFTVQPVDQTVTAGATATFGPVTVTGSPTPTLQAQRQNEYYEGSTADNFVEAEWTQLIAADSISWDGATVTISKASGSGVWNSNYAGCVESTEVRVTADVSDTNRILHIMNVISASDRIISTYNRGTSTLTIQTIKSGSVTTRTHVLSAYNTLKTVATATRSGGDWVFNVKIYTTGDVLLHDIDETFIDQYNPAVDYYLRMQAQDGTQTYTFMRIEGNGFPSLGNWEDIVGETTDTLAITNVGTTGDCFGTNYRFTATNSEGTAQSNTVTTIEA